MNLLVHLSDLHIAQDPARQALLFDKLVETLGRERASAAPERVVVAITGDVFDSASDAAPQLIDSFIRLHRRVVHTLGGDAPTIVLPGNHDRRRFGLLGPHNETLFLSLREAVDPRRVYVAGNRTPFLAQIVPAEFHGLPAHVIAYDSSYLPRGLVGAGGTIRLEDLLQAHAGLPRDGRPLVLLIHHHLIPTPITDVSHVDSVGAPRVMRWLVSRALPALVSNADREELTMTALGAGTALSTLHSFGRAVLLLHGHKHVPTARLVCGMTGDCGDVLLASAGSAGRREALDALGHADAARLWPSFNRVDLSEERVRVESVSFSPKPSMRPAVRRHLVHAQRFGPKWRLEPGTFTPLDPAPRVRVDEATFSLSPAVHPERWDFTCERRVELREGARLRQYVDFVHALPLLPRLRRTRARRRAGRRVELTIGGVTRVRFEQALCRTVNEAARLYGVDIAFEWVGLLCRYGATRATLRLARIPADLDPFGSVTDLTTGRERPVAIRIEGEHWTVASDACPPRTLLRIYWPLTLSSRMRAASWRLR
jgi:3',5'-cyclic AMP phosphodiesterase CpdA